MRPLCTMKCGSSKTVVVVEFKTLASICYSFYKTHGTDEINIIFFIVVCRLYVYCLICLLMVLVHCVIYHLPLVLCLAFHVIPMFH